MKFHVRSHPRIRAVGSVMEIWPMGNYIEYMPKGTAQQRIGQCWQRVGNQLTLSLNAYKKQNHDG